MSNTSLRPMSLWAVASALMLLIFAGPGHAADPQPTTAAPDRPLSLVECIDIALKNNPQIASADQSVVSARAGVIRARSSYYPQVSLDGTDGLGATAYSASGSEGTARMEDVSLTAAQTLWERGRNYTVAQSESSLRVAELSRTSTVQSLVEQVAGDYYAVLSTSQLVAVAEAGLASAESHLDQVKARIRLGKAAEVDVYAAEDDLARAQLDLIDARTNHRLALAHLRNTLSLPPGTRIELADAAASEAAEPPSLSEALETALAHRAEVLAGQAAVEGARSALRLASIRRGPSLDLSGRYSWLYMGRFIPDLRDSRARIWSWDVSLGFSLPVFDGYAAKADETAARASLARAEASYRQTVSQVGLEVETALVNAERARERVAASAASVAAAQARLEAAEGKYQQGIGILLEVIDARVALTNARASQVRARYDYQTALVTLQRALGTLSAPEPPGPEPTAGKALP